MVLIGALTFDVNRKSHPATLQVRSGFVALTTDVTRAQLEELAQHLAGEAARWSAEATRDWRGLLQLSGEPTLEHAKSQYRKLAMTRHADQGGSDAAMVDLNWAWEQAQKELTPTPA